MERGVYLEVREAVRPRLQLLALPKSKKGFTNVVTGLISVVIAIAIGAIVFAFLTNALTQLQLSPQANQTITQLFNLTWVAYSLLVIVPIVVVASVILVIIQGRQGRR